MTETPTKDAVLSLRDSVRDIGEAGWSQLSGTTRHDKTYNPFVSYAYLGALEESGCVGENSGWLPKHFLIEDEKTKKILGAAPTYLKFNSQGEYVFDHGWADAFERAGGRYYPKLQVSVPFTPASGPRLLGTSDIDQDVIRRTLARGLKAITAQNDLSSVHVTFGQERDIDALANEDYLLRTDQQFHFINDGYDTYDDFLGQLRSSKRKALKRERREALEHDIQIDWLTGRELTEDIWDQFFAFYKDTGSRKWGRPYLTRTFFSLIGERMADDILLVMARRNGRYIAGAINFIGSDRLFGRHWGCIEDHPFLHFEVCYHQAIDFAIAHKLQIVEAGAQGEHKLARGYVPVTTRSAHFITHPGLRRAIADYLEQERKDVTDVGDYLSEHTPFRKTEE